MMSFFMAESLGNLSGDERGGGTPAVAALRPRFNGSCLLPHVKPSAKGDSLPHVKPSA